MQYGIVFLEGVITFISPCLLPMLPIYLSYFAGGEERGTRRALSGSAGFVLGFTIVFVALGAFAGMAGSLLARHQAAVNLVTGLIVIAFGLSYLGVFELTRPAGSGFAPSLVLGAAFSISWTPCVGAFLGSALALASQQGHVVEGMLMLLVYSLGLGVPFVLSALLIDYLKSAFDWIKENYVVINAVCGVLLVALGALMATGLLGGLLNLLGSEDP